MHKRSVMVALAIGLSENDWVGADHRACATCSIRST